jgi:hypothetical protein
MACSTLRALARAIPAAGIGGSNIGDRLTALAREVRPPQVIVDIGPYLGSTTAFLALGCRAGVEIHAFDTWDARLAKMRGKAARHGVQLPDDFLPLYLANVQPFGVKVVPHREDVRELRWPGPEIGLLVDDIGTSAEATLHKFRAFGPWLAVGARLVLMDFYWFENKHHRDPRFRAQQRIAEANPQSLRFVERAGRITAIYEWLGGRVRAPGGIV